MNDVIMKDLYWETVKYCQTKRFYEHGKMEYHITTLEKAFLLSDSKMHRST